MGKFVSRRVRKKLILRNIYIYIYIHIIGENTYTYFMAFHNAGQKKAYTKEYIYIYNWGKHIYIFHGFPQPLKQKGVTHKLIKCGSK